MVAEAIGRGAGRLVCTDGVHIVGEIAVICRVLGRGTSEGSSNCEIRSRCGSRHCRQGMEMAADRSRDTVVIFVSNPDCTRRDETAAWSVHLHRVCECGPVLQCAKLGVTSGCRDATVINVQHCSHGAINCLLRNLKIEYRIWQLFHAGKRLSLIHATLSTPNLVCVLLALGLGHIP